jgi:hypothetical protein
MSGTCHAARKRRSVSRSTPEYLYGKIGFYTEDAQARFDDLTVYTVP